MTHPPRNAAPEHAGSLPARHAVWQLLPDWVRNEPRTIGQYVLAIATVFLIDLWVTFVVIELSRRGVLPPLSNPLRSTILDLDPRHIILTAPILEEFVYRGIPLWVVRFLTRSEVAIVFVAVIMSIQFGLNHGAPMNILVQGIGGFLMSMLYLKCGGLRGVFLVPMAVCITYHMSWNMMVAIVVTVRLLV